MALNREKLLTAFRLAPAMLVVAAAIILCSVSRDTAAQDRSPFDETLPLRPENDPKTHTAIPSFLELTAQNEAKDKGKEKAGEAKKKEWDPAVVSAGQAAFNRGCLKCHNAQRSLRKKKDYAGWLSTVKRMAAMRDAEVPQSDIVPITVYLASLNPDAVPPNGEGGGDSASGADSPADDRGSLSAFAVISPSWRGGSSDMEDRGFVPEAWFGAAWNGKIVSGRVSACVSCHNNKLDIVEAAVRIDLSQWLQCTRPGVKAGVEAGRFIVPFSAFSSAPMLYRTVARPLIFSMGQLLHPDLVGQSVLPMPYTDTGVAANFSIPLFDVTENQQFRVSWDGYVINGFSGTNDGIDWASVRNNYGGNQYPALGTRVTAGIPNLRVGASYMAGNFLISGNSGLGSIATGAVVMPGSDVTITNYNNRLDYSLYGFDVVAHYEDLVRFQFEYAHRANDRFASLAPNQGRIVLEEVTSGYYFELEARPKREFPVSCVVRYDRQDRRGPISPPGSSLPGTFNIQRFTWGVNVNLWRDSLLMFNHEHWMFSEPTGLDDVDIFGVRYMVSF